MPRPRSLRSLALAPNARRTGSPGPPSPTFSDSTHVSVMNFGANGPEKIITRSNLKASLQAYDEVSRYMSWKQKYQLYLTRAPWPANELECELSCCALDDVKGYSSFRGCHGEMFKVRHSFVWIYDTADNWLP